MNILKKLMGPSESEELISLAGGKLFFVRSPTSPKGEIECLYTNVVASVKESSIPFNYQLFVCKTETSDDDSSDSEGAESLSAKEDEWCFLIDESLKFRHFTNSENAQVIEWKDANGDPGDRFQLILSSNEAACERFMRVLWKCQFERKYQKPAVDEECREFEQEEPLETCGLVVSEDEFEDAETGLEVFQDASDIFTYNPITTMFDLTEPKAIVRIVQKEPWHYKLVAGKNISCDISSEMNPVFSFPKSSFVFNQESQSFLIKFCDFDQLDSFQRELMKRMWEHNHRSQWAKVSEKDQNFLVDSMNMMEIDEPMDDYEESEDEEDEVGKVPAQRNAAYDSFREKNSGLRMGYTNNRAFVSRGDKIGVFRTDPQELEFSTTIDNVRDLEGRTVRPKKMMMHEGDRHMIIQDAAQSLYKLDLTRGEIVEEWGAGEEVVKEVNPISKLAPTTGEQTVLGISSQGVLKLDPRLNSKNKVVDSKSYKSKVDFSKLCTTENGGIAIGNTGGEIRLYDRLGIRAKTQLPGLGESILGMDVSNDGRWVLATCEKYLLLIDVKIQKGRNEGSIGFMKPFDADSKPIPKRLTISPENASLMFAKTGKSLKFTPAKFNSGWDNKTVSIITSSGPFVISWSMKDVLTGKSENYLIKQYDDTVVNDDFQFGNAKNVVVAMSDDVAMTKKSKLKRMV